MPDTNVVQPPPGSERTVQSVSTDGRTKSWSYYYTGGDRTALEAQMAANAAAAGITLNTPINGMVTYLSSRTVDGLTVVTIVYKLL